MTAKASALQNLPKLSHHLVDDAQRDLVLALGYLSEADLADVIRACQFGDVAHIADKRKSGEPYITHPIAVAEILAGFELDRDTIIAAILHDTVEDTDVALEDLQTQFGDKVALLVDGVTKLKSSSHDKSQNKSATFFKIWSSTLSDPRVLVIKLADRLHNMSTLDAVRPEKQKSTAQETLDFYIPFARAMGLNDIADYIEILCYRNLDPQMYTKLSDKLLQHGLGRSFQQHNIYQYLTSVLEKLSLNGQIQVLDNRVNMYRQFFRNRADFGLLLRSYAFEVVLDTVEACDALADYLIKTYQIEADFVEDHIRRPLAGGNQLLRLTYQKDNQTVSITILTKQMQAAARLGVIGADRASEVSQSVIQASLRSMKELIDFSDVNGQTDGDLNLADTKQGNSGEANLPDIDKAVSIMDQLLHYLNARKILCYSPKGRAYELPRGATALDFAYAVGPFVGNIATGAKIDGQSAKLATVLQNGQTVEIETDKNAAPKADWLGFVATHKARNLIQRWFKDLSPSEKQHHGKHAFERALQTHQKSLQDITPQDWQDLLKWRGLNNKESLFEQFANGTLLPQFAVSRLFNEDIHNQNTQTEKALIQNTDGIEFSFAKCCNAVYGDPILGHLSKHGLVVHRHKCYSLEEIKKDNPYQIFQLTWNPNEILDHPDRADHNANPVRFTAFLKIEAVLNDEQISQAIYHLRQINIGVEQISSYQSEILLQIIVRSRNHIAQAIKTLRNQLGYPSIRRLYHMNN